MTNQRSSPISPRRPLVRVGTHRAADLPGRVFPWVAAGLVVSAGGSWLVESSPDVGRLAAELALPLVIGLVLLVIALDALIPRIGAGVGLLLLVVYSATVGVALSCCFILADLGSVVTAFVSAAGMFLAAALFCAATSRFPANLRGLLSLALSGFASALLVNLVIFPSPAEDLWISIVGVVAFVGLTAWHVWRTSEVGEAGATRSIDTGPAAALVLYLGVVNVFLDLVRAIDRFVGDTREDPAWHARHGLPTERRIRPR